MTLPHSRALWGYGYPQGAGASVQWGRRFPCSPDKSGIAFVESFDPLTIRPYALIWTAAGDTSFGVAFDAGVVRVDKGGADSFNILAGAGTIDARIEARLASFCVPGVLPVGYTANNREEWAMGNYGIFASGAPRQTWDIARRRTAAGWSAPTWLPDSRAITGTSATFSTGFTTGVRNGTYDVPSIGYRKLQVRVGTSTSLGAGSLTAADFNGTLALNLSHNTGGSSSPAVGGVTDFTRSIVRADFNAISGGTVFTPYFDAGAIYPTLGVLTQFLAQLDMTGVTATPAGSGGWSAQFKLSHAVNVPFPNLVSGIGNLIAPGGYVP